MSTRDETAAADSPTRGYIPALGLRALTPLYDPLLRWVMREERFKLRLIQQADLRPGMRVLDLGCGTGTLTSMIKRSQREAEVIGIDTDPAVLVQARAKAARAGLTIAFDLGSATDLPYLDSSFDRILTCLVLHHLTSDDKQRAFNECFRVLAEDGELHIADLGPPTSLLLRGITLIMGRFEQTADNFAGRLPGMLARAGFVGVETRASFASIFGGLSLLRALRPAEG